MSVLETIRGDVDALAGKVGDVAESLVKKGEADVSALEARLRAYIDAKFEALVGKAEGIPSTAVADLGKVVASITPAPAARPNASAPGASP